MTELTAEIAENSEMFLMKPSAISVSSVVSFELGIL
jgi:hypothetical protein